MGRGRVSVTTHPGVKADVVMVSARREEDRLAAVPLGHLESKDVSVKAEGPFDVRHLQVNVADAGPRVYDSLGPLARLHSRSSSWISLTVILPPLFEFGCVPLARRVPAPYTREAGV